jgi:protease secretion system outer membrane protein
VNQALRARFTPGHPAPDGKRRINQRFPKGARVWATLAILLGVLPALHAEPLTLIEAWQAARDHEPEFLAARHERDAGLQSEPIGRAELLPKVSASVARAQAKGDRDVPTITGETINQDLDYTSSSQVLQLRQPIYNAEAIGRFRLGRVQADYARAAFAGAELDLIVRVAQAYFDLLLAQDLIDLAQAQVVSYEEQARRAAASFERGEGTRTDISDAQARAALGQADLIDAKDRFVVAQEALAAMIGYLPVSLPEQDSSWLPTALDPPDLDAWLATARERSPNIEAQRLTYEAAKRNVSIARAGYQPSLELVASVSSSDSESTTTLNQKINENRIGVQLTVPLFAGGGVRARVSQAAANSQREQALLDATISKVLLEVRRNWLAVTNAWAKLDAYRSAVESAQVVQRGVEVGIRAGMNVQADALDATRLLYIARRDLASARYEFLLARLKLKAFAGTLAGADMDSVDQALR